MTDMDRLRAQLTKPVTPWNPSKSDKVPTTIVGRIINIGTTTSDYDASASVPILEVEDDDAIWRVVAWHSSLARELDQLRVRTGDAIGVTYTGLHESTTGKGSFHGYRVVHERGPGVEPEPEERALASPPEDIHLPLDSTEEPF